MSKNITRTFTILGLLVFLFPPLKVMALESSSTQINALRTDKQIVTRHCAMCHGNPGIPGAPRTEAEWKLRITEKGMNGLIASTIDGKNAMPPKGMCMDCTPAELRGAISLLVYGDESKAVGEIVFPEVVKNDQINKSAKNMFGIHILQPGEDLINVHVLSAVVKDQTIPDAEVIFQKNGKSSTMLKTDADGNAIIQTPFMDSDDGVLMIIKKEGYSTLVAKCPCNKLTYAISPIMTKLDGLRVVLNWGSSPLDIDSHMIYPGNNIFYNARVGTDGNLDVDDTDGYGPETTTIAKKHFGEEYIYAVHDYTNKLDSSSMNLSKSGATVYVYIGHTLIHTYNVPQNKTGNLWTVFSIDGQGEFHEINSMRGIRAEGIEIADYVMPANQVADTSTSIQAGNPSAIQTMTQTASVSAPAPESASSSVVHTQVIDEVSAKKLNKQGEDAYHAKDFDRAIDLYRKAIEKNPNFGQAYSNLGLAFRRAGFTAEALWADRKAIALASGKSAKITRANAYYNIGRIYEDAGQFDDALKQYKFADTENPKPDYKEAIERMNQKSQN